MKKALAIFAVTAAIGVGAVMIFAQKGRPQGFGPFGGRGFDRIASKLGLSEEQKAQAKTILEDSKTRIQPLAEALRANHEKAEKLGTDGVYNEAAVAQLADEQSAAMRQMIVEKEKTKAALFAVLTPEQRVQAEQLKGEFKERFRDGFKKGRRGGPGGEFGMEE